MYLSLPFEEASRNVENRRGYTRCIIGLRRLHCGQEERTRRTRRGNKRLYNVPKRMRNTECMIGPSRRHMDSVIKSNHATRRLDNIQGHLEVSPQEKPPSVYVVRYNGTWYAIKAKPFEPERMSTDIAWLQIKEQLTAEQAYKRWFEDQRKISRVLQQ